MKRYAYQSEWCRARCGLKTDIRALGGCQQNRVQAIRTEHLAFREQLKRDYFVPCRREQVKAY